jgi:hypothetical protein
MVRKLKTYTTSAGFFDLAVAAPSMKAALEAWGVTNNLFHHGFAQQVDDPTIVAATMAKPGVVLRRPVGTDVPFSEHAELPSNLPVGKASKRTIKERSPKSKATVRPIDERAARKAALAFEREQERQRRQAEREEAAREKERQRHARVIEVARAALDEAEAVHRARVADIEKARASLDRKLDAEESRWKKERERLETALRHARSPHLRLV